METEKRCWTCKYGLADDDEPQCVNCDEKSNWQPASEQVMAAKNEANRVWEAATRRAYAIRDEALADINRTFWGCRVAEKED